MRPLFPFFAVLLLSVSARAGTLEDIQSRGVLTCGVAKASAGLSDMQGSERRGLAIDLCRLMAAAVVGRPEAVAFVEVTAVDAPAVLQAEEADVLLLAMPWSFANEVEQGLILVQPLLQQTTTHQVFGPVVRQGDDSWFLAWRWVLATAQRSDETSWPESHGPAGEALGLQPGWNLINGAVTGRYEILRTSHMKEIVAEGWRDVPDFSGAAR